MKSEHILVYFFLYFFRKKIAHEYRVKASVWLYQVASLQIDVILVIRLLKQWLKSRVSKLCFVGLQERRRSPFCLYILISFNPWLDRVQVDGHRNYAYFSGVADAQICN